MIKKMIFSVSIILCLVLFMQNNSSAQGNGNNFSQNHTMDFGAGFGLDYGGLIGVKLSYILPSPHISIFGAVGVQIVGIGWNVGTTFHIRPETDQHTFRPNIKIMYGINRSTVVLGLSEYDMLYSGITPGFGLEFMFGRQKKNGFDIDINIPIGSSEYKDQIERMENDPRVGQILVTPVTVSIGYHREF